MRQQHLPPSRFVAPVLILITMIGIGCTGKVAEPTPASIITASSSPVIPETVTPTPTKAPVVSPTVVSAPTSEPVPLEGVLYEDDFTGLAGGWPELEFDNSYIGYHEPEYYHVEVQAPNDDELVPVPDKSYTDFTVEVEVFAVSDLTSATGDYHYGLVFRRSGKQYYAFTISPPTKKWFVLKSSPTGLEVLQEGSNDTIQGLGTADSLRVDAQGSNFFFQINGQPVSLMIDADYSSGEVGFVVQTFDSPQAHIHYDKLTIREVEAPQLICDVVTQALNLRIGPSTTYRLLNAFVLGDRFKPLGRTPEGLWIQVKAENSGQLGWVANDPKFVSCNVPIADLPVSEP